MDDSRRLRHPPRRTKRKPPGKSRRLTGGFVLYA
jgi:hypothetical protein